jgi:hypothetical protein
MPVAFSQTTNLSNPQPTTHEGTDNAKRKHSMASPDNVQDAISKINALRKLTKETGCVTRRTQSLILGTLTPNELTAVAEILALQPDVPRG